MATTIKIKRALTNSLGYSGKPDSLRYGELAISTGSNLGKGGALWLGSRGYSTKFFMLPLFADIGTLTTSGFSESGAYKYSIGGPVFFYTGSFSGTYSQEADPQAIQKIYSLFNSSNLLQLTKDSYYIGFGQGTIIYATPVSSTYSAADTVIIGEDDVPL